MDIFNPRNQGIYITATCGKASVEEDVVNIVGIYMILYILFMGVWL